MKRWTLLGVAFLGPAVAQADEPHTHDGLYLRLDMGLAFASMSADTDLGFGSAEELKISGAGGTFGLAVGGSVTENLVLFGELFDDVVFNPTVEYAGVEADTMDTSVGVFGFGAGLAYYFMPSNLYLSLTLAAAMLQADVDGEKVAETDLGFGANFLIGKEWWVSDQWGLGLAGQFFLGKMKDSGEDAAGEVPSWTTVAFGVVFSATFN